jgi:uncharacterized protein (TIGR04562 family)
MDAARVAEMAARSRQAQHGEAFAWDALAVILEGASPLELPRMAVATRPEAHEFLCHYGFDLRRAEDRTELVAIHEEAIEFIRKYFLSSRPGGELSKLLDLPPEVAQPEHLADLLVLASNVDRPPLTLWACAVLRVMHTIHHANRAFRKDSFDEIRRQILEPFRSCIHVDELGCPVLGDDDQRVQLEGVFFKEDKSRDSIILKLLHKPNNVAQEIYDWIGIQFVTRSVVDALLVVRFLRAHNLVIFSNIVPGRSINNLVDLQSFRHTYEQLLARYKAQDDRQELWLLEHLSSESRDFAKLAATLQNPFSGQEYRSIQFTCRQLIRVPNPARKSLQDMLERMRQQGTDGEVLRMVAERLEEMPLDKELSFFFPYEIQILDYENYLKTRMGESSHAAYKKRQITAARRRVLQGLL